jgi:mycothiol synthase
MSTFFIALEINADWSSGDDVTRTAVFEPVGTHPNHQKRGLGKAVMSKGLRRAQRLGATLAAVSSYGKAVHALYEFMVFTEVDLLEPWIKEFGDQD